MKRGKPLKPDPAKVREFLQRGRQPLKRGDGGLARSELPRKGKGGANPPRPENASTRVGPLSPGEWRRAVWALDHGKCVGCGAGPFPVDADRWVWQAHHPIEKQSLPPGRKYDPRNGVVLCRRCHERHTTATRRVPQDRLPERARSFARELGPWAEDLLLRFHPVLREEPGDGEQSR